MDAVGEAQRYHFGDFELDLGAHMLRLNGEPVRLERRPFELLVVCVPIACPRLQSPCTAVSVR